MGFILGIPEATLRDSPSRQSVTIYACAQITEWNKNHSNNAFAKYIVTELAFAGTTILGAFETVAAMVYALALKGGSFFVSNKNEFEDMVMTPVRIYAASSFLGVNLAIVSLIENIKSLVLGDKAFDKVMSFYSTNYA